MRNEEKVPTKIQGIIIDITQEKDEAKQREEAQKKLEDALASVISGFVPICLECKAIRDNNGNWIRIDYYIAQKQPVQFSHRYCPECAQKALEDLNP